MWVDEYRPQRRQSKSELSVRSSRFSSLIATPAAARPPDEGGEVDGCAVGELVTRTLILQ